MEAEVSRVRVEYSPLLRGVAAFLSWTSSWAIFAFSTGIVWEFLLHGSLIVDRVIMRSILVGLILVSLIVVVFLVDVAGTISQYFWDNYPWKVAKRIIGLVALMLLAIAAPYLWQHI